MTKVIPLNSLGNNNKPKKSFKDHKFALTQALTSKEKNAILKNIINWLELFSRDPEGKITMINLWKIMSLTRAWKFQNPTLVKELMQTLNSRLPANKTITLSDLNQNYRKEAA